jgi:hypothetical protein
MSMNVWARRVRSDCCGDCPDFLELPGSAKIEWSGPGSEAMRRFEAVETVSRDAFAGHFKELSYPWALTLINAISCEVRQNGQTV